MEAGKKQVLKIAEEYFGYMAGNYPVMCLSDEFYFFPRAKKAVRFLHSLDSLDEQKIAQDTSRVKSLKSSLETISSRDVDFETRVDLALLSQSMSTFLREFDRLKIWQRDPSLYLKIILLGIDQVTSKFFFIRDDVDECLRDRIALIPGLLKQAQDNLKQVPQAYLEVSIEMAGAAIDYFKNSAFPVKNKYALLGEINLLTQKALGSLEDFKNFLLKLSSRTLFIKDRNILETILRDSFSYKRSLEEVFEIASLEYSQTLKHMKQLAGEVESGRTWQEILASYRIDVKDAEGLLRLYSGEIERIRNFIKEKDIITIPETQDIQVRFTPQFMKPVRASASYSSPVTDDDREPAYFYITADLAEDNKPGGAWKFSNLHNEYIFVTAHETFPGHHLLDTIRRGIANPVRQQIESPFFYEGWASYAERLVDGLGYVNDPAQRLLGLKRQAWRAVRAMLDVGIRINKLKFEQAEALLKDLGYEPRIAKFMFRHYALSQGYQLCYTIGKFEIDKLKEKFSPKLGIKRFHDLLLEGGQVPFDLIEEGMGQ